MKAQSIKLAERNGDGDNDLDVRSLDDESRLAITKLQDELKGERAGREGKTAELDDAMAKCTFQEKQIKDFKGRLPVWKSVTRKNFGRMLWRKILRRNSGQLLKI